MCLTKDGVVTVLYNGVLSVSGVAVMRVQCEQEGAEHAALRAFYVVDHVEGMRCDCHSELSAVCC